MIKLVKESLQSKAHEEFFDKVNEKGNGFLDKIKDHPDLAVILPNEMDYYKGLFGKPNKCETNTWNYVKMFGDEYYPVSGFLIINDSLHPIEHWWAYSKHEDKFYEMSPINRSNIKGYIGIINQDINDDINKSEDYWDVDFFKGGYFQRYL